MKGTEDVRDDEETTMVAVKLSLVVLVRVRVHLTMSRQIFQRRQPKASRISLELLECVSDVWLLGGLFLPQVLDDHYELYDRMSIRVQGDENDGRTQE